jgi:signal transduction histidine kinase
MAVLSTLFIARFSPLLSGSEFAVMGELMALRQPRLPDPHIVLVGVSKRASDDYDRAKRPECACAVVPRCDLGEAIARAKQAGARVVVLDLMLAQTCPLHNPEHDLPLEVALDQPGETVITARANPMPDKFFFAPPPGAFLGPPERPHLLASPLLYNPHNEIRGVRLIQIGASSTTEKEQASGLELVGENVPPICLAAYTAYRGDPCEVPMTAVGDTISFCDVDIPVWADGRIYLLAPFMPPAEKSMDIMLINWAGPAGTIPMLSLYSVNQASPRQLASWFKGKVVIVGSEAERLNTPMPAVTRAESEPYLSQQGEHSMSGMEVHGQALDTILQRKFLRPLPTLTVWAILLGCCLLTSLAFLRLSLLSAGLVSLIEAGLLFLFAALLIRRDVWLYTVIPTTGVALSAVATGLWGYARSRHEAAELAEEAETRETTTATLVHDLKQPLAAISGLTAAIRATQLSEHADVTSPELVQRIQRQVERALADIDDLLMTSPGREVALQPQRFDLAALARDLAVAQSLKSTVHEVEVHSCAEEVWLTADPRYVGRALENLVDNAIKYWPEGGTIVVEVLNGADHAQVRVIDGGLGMSPEQQARIFERFHRAVPTGVAIPGSGLGLYSVKRIVEAHGGAVEVQSQAGAGSTLPTLLTSRTSGTMATGRILTGIALRRWA